MRTGEIVDLAKERRLSAVLEFSAPGGELLILNGGSRAEELIVVTVVERPVRSESRAAYCVDAGTSLPLTLPVTEGTSPDDIEVRVIGGHGEMILGPSGSRRRSRRPLRTVVTTLGSIAAILALVSGTGFDPASSVLVEPVPAPAEVAVVRPKPVSLRVPHDLAKITLPVATPAPVATPIAGLPGEEIASAVRTAPRTRRHDPAPHAAAARPAGSDAGSAMPRMTALHVPSTAKSGDTVPVVFRAVARQVKIVASIGPTIVSKTIVGAQHGVVTIRSPRSDLDSRVMTVRAYAQDGNRTATLQAMVVLIRP